MESLKRKISMARANQPADIVYKNARVIDVFSNQILFGDIAVSDGEILGVGSYHGKEEIDLEGKFVSPTLVDSHMHIESTMSTPVELSKLLIANGVTTIIADPHEIANVCGLDGINFLIESSKNLPIDVKIMLPSCVPSTPFENAGANLDYSQLKKLNNEKEVLGLGEMMNYVGLLDLDEVVLEKIIGYKDLIIDGHAPGLLGNDLNAYVYAGVNTDHECSTVDEMKQRISNGMYVLIRQGTSAKNAKELIKGVTKDNLSRCLFCSDDKHPQDLINNGSVNENVKIAIKNGIDPIDAIKMASINASNCYGLKHKGAIAPGYEANFIVLDSLEEFSISSVYIAGKKYFENGNMLVEIEESNHNSSFGNVNLYDYSLEDFEIKLNSNKCNVIGLIPNELITEKLVGDVRIEDGKFIPDNDYLKLLVIERHHGLRSIGHGIIKGFGIKNGAIASTIAHDSHNLIIVGDNDKDMFKAMREIEKIHGGVVVVQNEEVLASLPLEIGGLMSTKSIEEINKKLEYLLKVIKEKLNLQNETLDPIITLGFMALPVIPKIKLTDKGLFDVEKFEFIDINA